MKKILFILIVGLLLIPTQNILAQKNNNAQKKPAVKKTKIIPEWRTNFELFIIEVEKNGEKLNKSEYETNAEFEKRITDRANTPEYQSLLTDTFSFFLEPLFIDKYNAENKTLSLTMEGNPIKHSRFSNRYNHGCTAWELEDFSPICVFFNKSYTKKYKASNAFGAEIEVTQNIYDACYLYSNKDFIDTKATYTFPCEIDIAKNSTNFKYKFYFTLSKMVYSYCFSCGLEPTFDEPIQDCIRRKSIDVNIQKIEIIYNKNIIYTINSNK